MYHCNRSAVDKPMSEKQTTIQPSFEYGIPNASSMPWTGNGVMASSLE